MMANRYMLERLLKTINRQISMGPPPKKRRKLIVKRDELRRALKRSAN